MIYCGVSVKKSLFERDKHRVKNGSFNKDWVKVKKMNWQVKTWEIRKVLCYFQVWYGIKVEYTPLLSMQKNGLV